MSKKLTMTVLAVAVLGFSVSAGTLPAGYKQLEYVQGSGTAYIDLGTKLTQADTVVAEVELPSEPTVAMIYGSRTSGSSSDCFIWGTDAANPAMMTMNFYNSVEGQGRFAFAYAELCGHRLVSTNCAAFRRVVDLSDGGKAYEKSNNVTYDFTTASDIRLFWASGTVWASATQCFTGKVYSFAIIRDGVPRMKLVPCRNGTGEVGFFDVVNAHKGDAAFYANAATSGSGFITGTVATGVLVEGSPVPYEVGGEPLYGEIEKTEGDAVSLTAPAFVQLTSTERAVCTGWKLYDRAMGDLLDESTDKTRLTCAFTYKSAVRLVWEWDVRRYVVPAAELMPDGYTLIEYVQGSGTAYIELDTKLTQEDMVVAEVELPSEPTVAMIYGSRTSGSSSDCFIWGTDAANPAMMSMNFYNSAEGRFAFAYAGLCGHHLVSTNCAAFRSIVDLNRGGYETDIKMSKSFTTASDIRLFWASGGVWASATQCFTGKVYSFKIIRDGRVRMELVPCKNRASEVGFFDVTNADKGDAVFYGNAATSGDGFIAGPVATGVLVEGSPAPCETDGKPLYGKIEKNEGEAVLLTAPAFVQVSSTERAVCTGWKLYDRATGNLLDESTDGTRLTCAFTYKSAVRLVWQWDVRRYVLPVAEVMPDGYRLIEYVQGSGTAYIDLGTKLTQADTVVVEVELPAQPTVAMIYGSRTSGNSSDCFIWGTDAANPAMMTMNFYNSAEGQGRFSFAYAELCGHHLVSRSCAAFRRIIDLSDGGKVYEKSNYVANDFTTASDIRLFWASGTVWASATQCFTGKVYSFKIIRDGMARMELVPCKNRTGEVGFFDIANADMGDAAFYGNAATSGSGFIAGRSLMGFMLLLK